MTMFSRFCLTASGVALAVTLGAVALPRPALAGFDWTPPAPAAPMSRPAEEMIPEMPAMQRDRVEAIDLPVSAPVSSSAPAAVPAVSTGGFDTAEGFGNDIPLAMALRQIVPAQYAYRFDGSVDQGARVTWNGGKPWNTVLTEALAPAGLTAQVAGSTVSISNAGAPPVAQAAAPSAPPLTEQDRFIPVLPPVGSVSVADETSAESEEVYIRRETPSNTQDRPGIWSRLGLTSVASAPVPAPDNVAVDAVDDDMMMQDPGLPLALTAAPDDHHDDMAPAMSEPPVWRAEKGDSLRLVLQNWSDNAGTQLFWSLPADYVLPDAIRVQGRYEDAVMQVLAAYGDEKARPVGKLYPNLPAGPAVLVIDAAPRG